MIDNKLFAMFFNAGPRKGWNTHKMLEAAKAGRPVSCRVERRMGILSCAGSHGNLL